MARDLTQPCNQCGAIDYYSKGEFSYCKPCHTESQKKYMQNKAQGSNGRQLLKPPSQSLSFIVSNNNSLKPFCRKGHPLSGDNVRISSQRKGKHLRRLCRACERNAKRVSYGLKPEPLPTKLTDVLDSQ